MCRQTLQRRTIDKNIDKRIIRVKCPVIQYLDIYVWSSVFYRYKTITQIRLPASFTASYIIRLIYRKDSKVKNKINMISVSKIDKTDIWLNEPTDCWRALDTDISLSMLGVICQHIPATCLQAKGQGQRAKVKVTEVTNQISRFRTVTPVWIHIWWLNDAYSLLLLRRGAL